MSFSKQTLILKDKPKLNLKIY